MQKYKDLVEHVLENGTKKENRTGVDTLSCFNYNYSISIENQFPLLTTKDMSGSLWNSLVHELLWYLSGDHHINDFTEESSIWDAWADDDNNLETAYGRFWRRYPIPDLYQQLEGESWPTGNKEIMEKYVNEGVIHDRPVITFDQIAYIVDTLINNPYSRRMVLTAWHPANAAPSRLPPCHYSACFNINDGKLNCHLTQRSGDIGLGIPFNIASYSLLTRVLAKATGYETGEFAHTIVDAHIYCGDDRDDPQSHVEALEKQTQREPRDLPTLDINKPEPDNDDLTKALDWIDALSFNDFKLKGYDPHPRIKMKVAV